MTPSPDAWFPSQAVGKVKNVAGWSSPVAREAHNLEVTGSNPVPATWPVLTTGSIPEEPAATRVVAAGSVVFCGSSPADAGACGVAFRVSMASHFALQFGTPPCPASPGIGSPLPPSDCEQTDGIWGIYQQHYDLDPRQPRPDDTQWTGAEIKSCCRLASLLDVPLVQAAQNVVPVAVTAGDKIEGLRQWASGRCLSADRAGVYSRAEVGSGRGRREVREPGVN